jgi:DNA-binding CsgD family transcriptional regulator
MTKPHVVNGSKNGAEMIAAVSRNTRRFENGPNRTQSHMDGNSASHQAPAEARKGLLLVELSCEALGAIDGTYSGAGEAAVSPVNRDFCFLITPEVQQAFQELGSAELAPTKICLRIGNREYKLRASRTQGSPSREDMLLLHLERTADAEDRIRELSVRYRLTAREEEALRGIAGGLASKELADRMNINPSTVKSFLRLTMIKLGVRTRGELFAKLLHQTENE